MIFFIFLLFSLHSFVSQGTPITSNSDTAVAPTEDAPVVLTNYRSTVQILWTCWVVIIASTWVCIYPHVPGYESTHWQRWGIRGRLFLFVTRAFGEWKGAWSIYSAMVQRLEKMNQNQADPAKPAVPNPDRLGNDAKLCFGVAWGVRPNPVLGGYRYVNCETLSPIR